MPLVKSPYKSPFYLLGGHVQTLFPSLFRKINVQKYTRERLITFDDDFIDVDWIKTKSKKCVILSHGLEGDSSRVYIKGMGKYLSENGYDICAWNFRGCSGEVNLKLRTYHSGSTEDLHTVVEKVSKFYSEIVLVGFSMGGNLSLKYLGEQGSNLDLKIKKSVVFSAPLDLLGSSKALEKWSNKIYMHKFLTNLKSKMEAKEQQFPDHVSLKNYEEIKTFTQFDNKYTAPINGFKNAEDYYDRSASLNYIKDIQIPTLIVNAQNDPFLSENCYPKVICGQHKYVFLEIPKNGGHVGFIKVGEFIIPKKGL